jgi:glycosyltransferase involved in cell wall biosynthesis
VKTKLKILIIVDSVFWVTGTMAKKIKSHYRNYDIIICSYHAFLKILESNGGKFPLELDIVHFFIATYGNDHQDIFKDNCAIVTTIHHVRTNVDLMPLEYSDAVQTVSKQWHSYLVEYGADPEKLVMVQNGIDTKLYAPVKNDFEKLKLRKKFNIPDKAFVVGFSAKHSSNTGGRKGIDVLERLIQQADHENVPIWWLIRGPGWEQTIQQLNNSKSRITYLPFLPYNKEVADSYRVMDAYIVTSTIEGGPVPLMEAMASGLVVISTPVGVVPDLIEDGINGFSVAFGNEKVFLERIKVLISNQEHCKNISLAARQTIEQFCTWQQVLRNIPKLYETASKNYYKRKNIINKSKGASIRNKKIVKEISLLNYQFASEELMRVGAEYGARFYATVGLLKAMPYPSKMKNFFFWTYFGSIYFKILDVIRR